MAVIEKLPYGTTPDGLSVEQYLLKSDFLEFAVITYGGIITSVHVPDRSGTPDNVVLGFASLEGYLQRHPYFGAITGRYANRIANGRFSLDGVEYSLAINNGKNALHGGLQGFDKRVWTAEVVPDGVVLAYVSPAGEEGYPGQLSVRVTYRLEGVSGLRIDYEAATDAPTVLNLTNHSYFNLAGESAGTVYDHLLMLDAEAYTPVNADLIPTGELASVAETPFDFRTLKPVGADIARAHPQLLACTGYDHNFVLSGDGERLSGRLYEPGSGRTMDVYTTEPGVQLYTGNFLNGTLVGPSGMTYRQSAGLCLETQHYPNSPNQPQFPTTVLRPGQIFQSTTRYVFSVH